MDYSDKARRNRQRLDRQLAIRAPERLAISRSQRAAEEMRIRHAAGEFASLSQLLAFAERSEQPALKGSLVHVAVQIALEARAARDE